MVLKCYPSQNFVEHFKHSPVNINKKQNFDFVNLLKLLSKQQFVLVLNI